MAQNDFLQFDENNENVLTQDAYREDEQRISGAKSGVARSSLFNKVLRQVSTFVAGFGQFISEKNINILEDLNSVKNALTNLFTAKNIGVSTEVQTLLSANNVDDGLKSVGDGVNKIVPVSYLAFVTSANANTLDASFGKNNESDIHGIGKALAMYSNFKNNPLSIEVSNNLKKLDTLSEICSDLNTIKVVVDNTSLNDLISASPYALEKVMSIDVTDDLILFDSNGSGYLDLENYSKSVSYPLSVAVGSTINFSANATDNYNLTGTIKFNFKNSLENFPFKFYKYFVVQAKGTFNLTAGSSGYKAGFSVDIDGKITVSKYRTSASDGKGTLSISGNYNYSNKEVMFKLKPSALTVSFTIGTSTAGGNNNLTISKIYLTNNI